MISERPRRWRIFDKIADRAMHLIVAACLWIVFSGIGLFLWGFRSKTVVYWIIAIIVFPFLCAAGEGLVELFRKMPPVAKVRATIDEDTKEKTFSGLRVAYLLLETLGLMGLVTGAWLLGMDMVNRWFP